jgi:serine/threonine protein phosphatase PrpC
MRVPSEDGSRRRETQRSIRRVLAWTIIVTGLAVGIGGLAAVAGSWPTKAKPVVVVTSGTPVTQVDAAFVVWKVSPSRLLPAKVDGTCPSLLPPAAGRITVAWVQSGNRVELSCLHQLRGEVRALAIGPRVSALTLTRQVVHPLANPSQLVDRWVHHRTGPSELLRTHVAQLQSGSVTGLLTKIHGWLDAQSQAFEPGQAVVVSVHYLPPTWNWHVPAPDGIAVLALLIVSLGAALTSARWRMSAAVAVALGLSLGISGAFVGLVQHAPAVPLCVVTVLVGGALILVGVGLVKRARTRLAPVPAPPPPLTVPTPVVEGLMPVATSNGDHGCGSSMSSAAPSPPSGLATAGDGNASGAGRPVLTLAPAAPAASIPTHQLTAGWPSVDAIGEAPSGAGTVGRPVRVVAVSDSACDGLSAGGLEVRAASVRGMSHRWNGRPRQDAFSFGTDAGSQHIVLAVADGVSSAPHAEIGAQLASFHSVELLVWALEHGATLGDLNGNALMSHVATRVRAGATFPVDEALDRLVATTLVVAVVETTPRSGYHRAWTAQVGNSQAIVLRSGQYCYLGDVADGGIVDNRVPSLPMRPESVEERCSLVPAGSVIFLCSDGITDALGHGRGSVGRYLAERLSEPPDPLELARTVGFLRKGFLDDRVLAGVWL